MMKTVTRFARKLANSHPILDAALVTVGAIGAVDFVYTQFIKPKASTAQTTATKPAGT